MCGSYQYVPFVPTGFWQEDDSRLWGIHWTGNRSRTIASTARPESGEDPVTTRIPLETLLTVLVVTIMISTSMTPAEAEAGEGEAAGLPPATHSHSMRYSLPHHQTCPTPMLTAYPIPLKPCSVPRQMSLIPTSMDSMTASNSSTVSTQPTSTRTAMAFPTISSYRDQPTSTTTVCPTSGMTTTTTMVFGMDSTWLPTPDRVSRASTRSM